MKAIKLGIRQKVLLGSVLIGLTLFLSGIIAFFEFGRMSEYVSTLISNSITNVNTSRLLMNISDEYNSKIMEQIGGGETLKLDVIVPNPEFLDNLHSLQDKGATKEERMMADSILYSYVAYIHVVSEIKEIWFEGYTVRKDWYFDRVQSVYDKMRDYMQKMMLLSQNSLADNYDNLNASFYRSIMPGVVSVGAGIMLVILFNYFLNLFLLTPLIKIGKGVKNYREFNKSYGVTFEYGGDQLQDLNEDIKEIIEENKALKKK